MFPSGWKSNYYYVDGNLVRQINYFKGELRLNERFEYNESIRSLTIKCIHTDTSEYTETQNTFDSLGRLEKSAIYLNEGISSPSLLIHNFQFDSIERIISYERTNLYQKAGSLTDCYEFKYHDNKLSAIIKYDSCKTIGQEVRIEYASQRSALVNIDHQNPEIVALGGRSENGVQRYLYKLDDRGNWIKRYYLGSNGTRILEIKRKVTYKRKGA